MAHTNHLQKSPHISFGQKLVNTAGTLKGIYDIGNTMYKKGKVAVPIIRALLK